MKVIAFYLPQFHEIPENNEWWGQGFTEWTAVKQAVPLFKGHNQPRVPLNGNYYNLLEKSVMEWQAQLMKQYNIFGMCFYHYYFKDGRQVLEKPAENLLKWTDIDMPFCFSWANESWVHSWENITGSISWTQKYEVKNSINTSIEDYLLEQAYGDEIDWKKHFYYMLPFFKDSRYIKFDGKPVFLIYRPELIDCLDKMVEYWQKLSRQEGFKGLYIIGSYNGIKNFKSLDAVYYHEPRNSFSKIPREQKRNICLFDYNDIWNNILCEETVGSKKTYFSAFVDFDSTPRHGKLGIVLEDFSPEKFEHYLSQLLKKSECCGNEYIFVNAWNEWGEGMYLEPDTKYGSVCLQAVSKALGNYKNIDFIQPPKRNFEIEKLSLQVSRYKSFWSVLDKWLYLTEKNISISTYFINHGITRIALYGLGMLSRHLITQLKDTGVKIIYGIDKSGNRGDYEFPVYYPDDELPSADAIVITVVYDYENITKMLQTEKKHNILSLHTIIQSLYNGLESGSD